MRAEADTESAWPDLVIAGVPKAGTTSVGRYLDEHPEITRVAVDERPQNHDDPRYFSRVLDDVAAGERDREEAEGWYTGLMARADGIRLDKTPSYFYHHEAPRRIHEAAPDARIVVLLRDPVERAYSHYRMHVAGGNAEAPFDEAIEADLELEGDDPFEARYVHPGRYADHLERYRKFFDDDRILIDFAEHLGQDTDGVVARIAEFAGADPDRVADIDTDRRFNTHKGARGPLARFLHRSRSVKSLARGLMPETVRDWIAQRVLLTSKDKPEMPDRARGILVDEYRDQVHRLDEILDQPLPWDQDRWGL